MNETIAIVVRPARLEDVPAIVSFSAAMAMETEGRRLDIQQLTDGTLALLHAPAYGFFRVAEPQDRSAPSIIGQLMVTFEWSDWRNGAFWWIQSVYVDPMWRRRGVFRGLHDSVMAEAKRRPDVCGVRLYVDSGNRVAQAAYRRVGLTPCPYAVYEMDFRLPHRLPLEDRPDQA